MSTYLVRVDECEYVHKISPLDMILKIVDTFIWRYTTIPGALFRIIAESTKVKGEKESRMSISESKGIDIFGKWLETVFKHSSERLVALETVLRWLETVLRWLETVLKWLEEVLNMDI